MWNLIEQLEKIKALISSTINSEKSFAYSSLQDLQLQLTDDKSLIAPFIESTQTLISSIIADIRVHDVDANEEIVSLALKCLGFMIYHPSIVATISKEYVDQVLESLVRLIMMTKVKLICNLGVWCISIQQLDASCLTSHFDSVLMAVVHCLDNPAGSLSTTFEAIQAVMKLTTQMSEKMRDRSHIWVPPIYRRLISNDKREREMCISCLLKIKSVIIPPLLPLSKAIAKDMKLKLLPGMNELLKCGKKVQALQAWRWFVCLLGSYSLKARHVVNELLKVPEQTFSAPDSQTLNATLDSWEGLIEALVYHPSKHDDALMIHYHQFQQTEVKSVDPLGEREKIIGTTGFSKSLKLIMTPLIGIMTSKSDLSVQTSCLSTWSYLLHKLDGLVNLPHVLDTVVEPIFKVVFSVRLEVDNILIWRFCCNIFQDFIQRKVTELDCGNLSTRTSDTGSPVSREWSLKNYFVNWLPWDCSQMDFIVRMMHLLFNQLVASTCLENSRLVSDTLMELFRSFLKGVHMDFAKPSTTYNSIMQSMNSVLMLVKMVCETALNRDDVTDRDFQVVCMRFLEIVTQELAPSILVSPLYKFSIDLKYISRLQLASEERCKMLMGTNPMGGMDMVSPMVYLTILYTTVIVEFSYKAANPTFIQQQAYHYFGNLLSAYDPLEVIHAVVAVLYMFMERNSLLVWTTIAKSLRDYMSGAKDLLSLDIKQGSCGNLSVCHLLLYPFVVGLLKNPNGEHYHNLITAADYMPSSEDMGFEQVIIELWVSLYCLFNSSGMLVSPRRNLFAEDVCSLLKDLLQKTTLSEGFSNSQDRLIRSLGRDCAVCIIENLHVEKVTPEAIKLSITGDSGITNCLVFVAWVMKLLWTGKEAVQSEIAISRVLAPLTHLVGCLEWQEDIFTLIKVFHEPLLVWLSEMEMKSGSIKHHIQLLWAELMKTLQHSWPPIVFDNSFLELLSPLLEKALGHPSPSILDPTITFWNSSFGDRDDLDFPRHLLPVLDKLSRHGKIKLKGRNSPVITEGDSNMPVIDDQHPSYKVTSTLHPCSKRVEVLEKMMDNPRNRNIGPCPKRKRYELTEHQKEVRRAQQGKGGDCSGHGPGIRTYTSVDFSQGNEESQDSQDIRDPELILDLLRKVA